LYLHPIHAWEYPIAEKCIKIHLSLVLKLS
jgi:hypothetical protein